MKRILMVIAPKDFRDEEYKEPREVFRENGFEVKPASVRTGEAIGMFGARVFVSLNLHSINVHDYDTLVIVGGQGMIDLWDNFELIELVKDFFKENKVIGAICAGPVVLANAGILNHQRATVFKGAENRLIEKGAHYVEEEVVRDGNIITAEGPEAAREFGEKIAEVLNESI